MTPQSHLSSGLEDSATLLSAHLPNIVRGVGFVLLVAPCVVYFHLPGLGGAELVTHITVVSPFISAMIYGAYWLEQSSLSAQRWPRIGKWFLGGLLGFLALNVGTMVVADYGFVVHLFWYWGFFASDIGGATGLAIGILEAQAIEQELLAERRRIRQEAARRRSQQFENFAKVVSHDLRNPLNVAWGRLDLARDENDSDHLSAIKDALARMDEIIEDVQMLTWSGQDVTGEDTELQRLGSVARTSWSYVDVGDARLEIEDNLTVCANHARLQRLLENLFRNAVEHGGPETIVRVGALPTGFFVEDDGPGIPRDKRTTVFDPGYSSGKDGTGLGLSIVKTIAEAHQWTVSVTTGRQGGARFEFIGISKTRCNGQSRPAEREPESGWSSESTERNTDPNDR